MSNELHGEGAIAAAGSETRTAPAAAPPASPPHPTRLPVLRLALVFAGAIAVCLIAYLAVAVPGPWFPSASPVAFAARDLQVTRGMGKLVGDELVVTASDASGMTIVSVATDLRSSDYAAIAWIGIDFPDDAEASLLWQTDYAPGQIHASPVRIESGRPVPASVVNHSKWIGRIKGVALAVRGKLAQPLILRGVVAKPMGAGEVLGDRVREWLAFEGWTGTSINTVTGGADIQALPLPLLLTVSIALAVAALALLKRWRTHWVTTRVVTLLAAFFVAGWLLLDARWTFNLVRQVAATHERFGGKSWEEKRLANDDGPLFAFVQKARAVMPDKPVRIFVVADAHYFRGRAAYHLYPNNVWFDPRANALPPANALRPGDWLLVYQRRGIQYDASRQRLRWDGDEILGAELKLAGQGAALFEIR